MCLVLLSVSTREVRLLPSQQSSVAARLLRRPRRGRPHSGAQHHRRHHPRQDHTAGEEVDRIEALSTTVDTILDKITVGLYIKIAGHVCTLRSHGKYAQHILAGGYLKQPLARSVSAQVSRSSFHHNTRSHTHVRVHASMHARTHVRTHKVACTCS